MTLRALDVQLDDTEPVDPVPLAQIIEASCLENPGGASSRRPDGRGLMAPRILILGHDQAGSLMGSYERGFREHGASVETYCLARALAAVTRFPRRRFIDPALARRRGAALSHRVVEDHRDADTDLAVVLKGEYLRPDAIAELRESLRCPVINFYPDDPFSELPVNRLVFGPEVLREYDGCYTFARRLVPAYRAAGVAHVEWLPFARDPVLHAPPAEGVEPEADVTFVGNLDRSRAEWLAALGGVRVVIHGDLRVNRRLARRLRGMSDALLKPPVFGAEMSEALGRGAISLNVLREQNKGSHNMRSFESPACGAFTISEGSEEIESLFETGTEIVTVRDPGELESTVERWLGDPEGRARIGAAGFRRVEHDTYARRCTVLMESWLT